MKYSKKCVIRNSELEISYDYLKDEYTTGNISNTCGEAKIIDNSILYTKNEQEEFNYEAEIEEIKYSLKRIMEEFEKKWGRKSKVIVVLIKNTITKTIYQYKVIQKHMEKYYSFTYVFYSETDQLLASKYYIDNSINIRKFATVLIEDYKYLRLEKISYQHSGGDLLLEGEAASKFFHEFIGHLLEEDHFVISPIRDKFKQKVFPKQLNVLENVDINISYDDLSNEIEKNIFLVEKGVINNLLSIKDNPHGLMCNNTGNAVINCYSDRFIPRMRSMDIDLPMVSINNFTGVRIEDFDASEMNPTEGIITFMVNRALYLHKGIVISVLKRFPIHFSIFDLVNIEMYALGEKKKYIHYCIKNNQKVFTKSKCSSLILRKNHETKCDNY